ncbi:DUF7524 family protein [Halobaculum lipolyticum]|uniref:Uncharacterized protein n=1 Tax=Halobaculum lipolyticum TaxID=3032001 RepID=A0ABD5WD15_9EURY|nr:hypothetical protein [Halobaculum sp. DT31]
MSSEDATLWVTLNRERLNEALAPESFATDDGFAVGLRNEGEPVHVHLRFTGPLADAASVAVSNHYVDGGATLSVPVSVAAVDAPVEGGLRVVTGHGAEGTEVAVTVEPRPDPIDVDESFARPPRAAATSDGGETTDGSGTDGTGSDGSGTEGTGIDAVLRAVPVSADPASLAVAGLAAAALVGAVAVAVVLDSLAVTLGVAAVVVAVAVAVYLLIR